ncbi:hypothetical protein CDAR_108331 [Caerostris darwini]|uniref:Uncharacterized protein n=1 Tax=Caerostris darwini TaxID=1538125 RepID=A0AAV4PVC2_9ARAC|nr:hypothetical protein CDAR_108331 [Caerostris darwini]
MTVKQEEMLAANKLPISHRKTTHLSAAKCRKLLLGRRKKKEKKKGSKLYSMKNETYLSEDLNIPAPAPINNSRRELCFLFRFSMGKKKREKLSRETCYAKYLTTNSWPWIRRRFANGNERSRTAVGRNLGIQREECFRDISLLTGREDLEKLFRNTLPNTFRKRLFYKSCPISRSRDLTRP